MTYYLAPIVWMAVIYLFSTDIGSVHSVNPILTAIFGFLLPDVSLQSLMAAVGAIRKVSHLAEYAVLSILWFRAIQQRKTRGYAVSIALGISVLYAGLDELHQGFVSSRTASIADVGLDATGAMIGLMMFLGFSKTGFPLSMKAKFFGWWFAWGIFSAIMVFIVAKGGGLSFWKMTVLILSAGLVSGFFGVAYYVRRR